MVDNVMYQAGQLDVDRRRRPGDRRHQAPARAATASSRCTGRRTSTSPRRWAGIAGALKRVAERLPLVFPVHPRTRANLERFGSRPGAEHPPDGAAGLHVLPEPVEGRRRRADRQRRHAGRDHRPRRALRHAAREHRAAGHRRAKAATRWPAPTRSASSSWPAPVLDGGGKRGRRPALWDGRAAQRIVEELVRQLAPADR